MVLRKDDRGDSVTVVREWGSGFTWQAHPDAAMQRTSQAIRVGNGIWLVDPMDADGLDEKLAELGEIAGVVMLGSHHQRHADELAQRHEVAVHAPDWFAESARDFDAPVELMTDQLNETGFELLNLRAKPWRQEGGLYHPERKTLVVSDTLMTTFLTAEEGRPELFPPARLAPTYQPLRDLEVERLLVSHGAPVFEDVEDQIERALNQEYRGTVAALLDFFPVAARLIVLSLRR